VVVNPTERNGPSKTTKPVRGVEKLRSWFLQKTPRWGFLVEPNSLQVSHLGVQIFNKTEEEKHTHGSAKFIGRLKVIDRQAFVTSFNHGIGCAKGFGFGLLQIVPIQK
jgi:CRISPR system Cascade subunit CasE